MNEHGLAAILARTYFHRLTVLRPDCSGKLTEILRDAPCALSRSAHVMAPAPPDETALLPESRYRLPLFTRPEVLLRLGDEVRIADGTGRVFRGTASDSIAYPSHAVTVVEVREVLPGETDPGQDSREAGTSALL